MLEVAFATEYCVVRTHMADEECAAVLEQTVFGQCGPVLHRCSGAQVLRRSGTRVLRCSGAQVLRAQVLRCSGAQVLRCSGLRFSGAQVIR